MIHGHPYMTERVEAAAKPALLVWAREDAGFKHAEVAKKLGVKLERLEAWERGEKRPTIAQLRKLGKLYRRPIAVFYLDVPPTTFRPMHDYRRLPGEVAGNESPTLHLQVRRAYERREIALDLYGSLGEPLPGVPLTARLSDDPEVVATRIREVLGVPLEMQIGWRDEREAFNAWRGTLENYGILVFQMVKVAVGEARGFSITDTPLPVIVVNRRDSLRGRIFTLFHELTHVLLRDGGLCDLEEEEARRDRSDQEVEVFCNGVAAAALLPRPALLGHAVVQRRGGGRVTWPDDDLLALARDFKVSREAVLRRLLTVGRTTADFYQTKRRQFLKELRLAPKKGGFVTPDREALSTAGRLYVRLVLQGYYQEKITSSDVSDYLSVRLNHLGKIERAVGDTAPEAAAFV